MGDTQAPSAIPARRRLDALSGIRFFAIAYVMCRHVGDAAFEKAPAWLEAARLKALVVMPLFFVLSGFVLTYTYLELVASGRLSRTAFWWSRLWRILPVYLVAMGLQFAIDATVNRGVPPDYVAGALAQLFMVQAWTPPLVWFGNPPAWTVSVEVFFYALFPWLVVALHRANPRRRLVVAGVAWGLGQAASLAYSLILPDGWPPSGKPAPFFLDLVRYLPPVHLPSFLIGVVTALAFLSEIEEGTERPGRQLAFLGALPIVATVFGALELLGHVIPVFRWPYPFTHDSLLAPSWALVVYGLAHSRPEIPVLSWRPVVRAGEASYGLYILHFPVYNAVATWLVPDWDRTAGFLPLFYVIVIPIAVLSFERFEQPVRNAILSWSDRLPALARAR